MVIELAALMQQAAEQKGDPTVILIVMFIFFILFGMAFNGKKD